jgi:hypothetical protein
LFQNKNRSGDSFLELSEKETGLSQSSEGETNPKENDKIYERQRASSFGA